MPSIIIGQDISSSFSEMESLRHFVTSRGISESKSWTNPRQPPVCHNWDVIISCHMQNRMPKCIAITTFNVIPKVSVLNLLRCVRASSTEHIIKYFLCNSCHRNNVLQILHICRSPVTPRLPLGTLSYVLPKIEVSIRFSFNLDNE